MSEIRLRTKSIENDRMRITECRMMQIFVQNIYSYGMPVAFCRKVQLYDKKLQAFRTSMYFVRIFALFDTSKSLFFFYYETDLFFFNL